MQDLLLPDRVLDELNNTEGVNYEEIKHTYIMIELEIIMMTLLQARKLGGSGLLRAVSAIAIDKGLRVARVRPIRLMWLVKRHYYELKQKGYIK